MIYTPEQTTMILSAMQSIEMGNNGYADIGNNQTVIDAVRSAGYIVLSTRNLHGNPTHIGYTKAAQAALRDEPYAVPFNKPRSPRVDGPDYEAMILARQERMMMDY